MTKHKAVTVQLERLFNTFIHTNAGTSKFLITPKTAYLALCLSPDFKYQFSSGGNRIELQDLLVFSDSIFLFFQEVAEPLQDLKEGMDQLEKNKTLRYILATLLAIGNFLNSTDVSASRDVNGFLMDIYFLDLCVVFSLPPFPPALQLLLLILPALLPTYLFGRVNSGLLMCTRMCCLTDCLSAPHTVLLQ